MRPRRHGSPVALVHPRWLKPTSPLGWPRLSEDLRNSSSTGDTPSAMPRCEGNSVGSDLFEGVLLRRGYRVTGASRCL